jgi:hypothetical protein
MSLKDKLEKLKAKKHSAVIWTGILLIAVATLLAPLCIGGGEEVPQAEPLAAVEDPAEAEEAEEAEEAPLPEAEETQEAE